MRFVDFFAKWRKKTEKWRKTQLANTDFAEQNEEKDFSKWRKKFQNEEKIFLIVFIFF